MRWFGKRQYNAICPYCLQLANLEVNEQRVCGFCESELMRGMNFFIPLDDFFRDHPLSVLEERLAKLKLEMSTASRQQRFYYRDAITGLKQVIRLWHHRKLN